MAGNEEIVRSIEISVISITVEMTQHLHGDIYVMYIFIKISL